jgi:hypothetical protein
MYTYGSTLGRTNYPCYYDKDGYHTLVRPYACFKPNSPARKLLDHVWFTNFVEHVEKEVVFFLRTCYPDKKKAKMTLFYMSLAKKVIPSDCRICGSCFNHMTVLGKCEYKEGACIKAHTDELDIITALFHVGKPESGGGTLYYSGSSTKKMGELIHNIAFEHGRLQIGFFDTTLHAAEAWVGIRGGINFNIKKNVLKFFQNKTLKRYYLQYKNAGFPENFVAS